MFIREMSLRLTTRITDPAQLAHSMKPRRYREGMRFVNGAP